MQWYEFFAGGGMARLGLGERWRCVFANEWPAMVIAARVLPVGGIASRARRAVAARVFERVVTRCCRVMALSLV